MATEDTNPYAAFGPAVANVPDPPNPYAQFGDARPLKPEATWHDRLQAAESGILSGGAHLPTMPADMVVKLYNENHNGWGTGNALFDTAAHAYDATRAGVGAAYRASGNQAPSWTDPNARLTAPGDLLARVMDQSPITTTQVARPDDPISRGLYTAGNIGINAAGAGGGTLAGTLRAGAGLGTGTAVAAARPFGDNDAANNLAATAAQLALPAGSSALIKALMRGSSSPATVQKNIEAFRDVGAEPSLGQATGNRPVQFVESALSKIPGGAGVFSKFAERQAENMGAGVNSVVGSLADEASPEAAGRAIEQGVTGPGGALENFRAGAKDLYDAVGEHIAPDAPVSVKSTLGTLDTLTKPVPGAENTSALLVNPKVASIRQALMADLGNTDGSPMTLPYQTLAGLRSQVGDMLGGSELITGVSRGQLKRLYGALSQDMQGAAQDAGPDAVRAFNAANDFYREGADRMDMLSNLIDKQGGPEAVFKSALSGTKDGASRLRDIYGSIGQDQANVVTASVLKRMGLASPGAQGAAGDTFSPQSFLSNWNKISAEAKDTLFGPSGTDLRSRVDHIADVSENIKSGSRVFANASGTAGAEEATHTMRDVLTHLASGAGGALMGHGGMGLASLVHGGLGLAAVPAAAYGAAKVATSPGVVHWAASPTRPSAANLAAALINQNRFTSQQPSTDEQRRQSLARALGAQGGTP